MAAPVSDLHPTEKNAGAVYCVVTAAGSGTRLGYAQPKALVPVGGIPMVVRAVAGILAHPRMCAVVVTAPAKQLEEFESLFAQNPRVRVVSGGKERQDSVEEGLRQLARFAAELGQPLGDSAAVLIHDAARPLTPTTVVARVVEGLEAGMPAVIPALPVTDTVKIVAPAPTARAMELVVGAADRATLRAVQTPQGFHWGLIRRAHHLTEDTHAATPTVTDDAALVEALGEPVYLCEGSELSLKVTTPFDLEIANFWAVQRAKG